MVIEYVMDSEEFESLVKGTCRFVVEKEPVTYTKLDGSGGIQSGAEVRLIVKLTGRSKDDPNRIVGMKIDCGFFNMYSPEFKEKLEKVKEAAQAEFPAAKPGVFM